MRILLLSGLVVFFSQEIVEAATQGIPEVEVTFEDADEGLLVSFAASIDLTGLTLSAPNAPFANEPFITQFAGVHQFGTQFTSASSEASVDEYTALGTFEFAFNVFDGEDFSSVSATNNTGDNFSVAVRGSDIPFLIYRLPTGYVSGTPLSGSVTFADLAFEEVSPLLGTLPLDEEGTRFISFRASADIDADDDVDGADFLALQRNDPGAIPAWQAQFSSLAPLRRPFFTTTTVPEPSAGSACLLGLAILLTRLRLQVR